MKINFKKYQEDMRTKFQIVKTQAPAVLNQEMLVSKATRA